MLKPGLFLHLKVPFSNTFIPEMTGNSIAFSLISFWVYFERAAAMVGQEVGSIGDEGKGEGEGKWADWLTQSIVILFPFYRVANHD